MGPKRISIHGIGVGAARVYKQPKPITLPSNNSLSTAIHPTPSIQTSTSSRLTTMKITHVYLVVVGLLGLDLCLAVPVANTTVHHLCPCRKRSHQFLIDLFNTINSNANCFSVEVLPTTTAAEMLGPEQNTTSEPTSQTLFSILSGDSSCLLGLQQNAVCFERRPGQPTQQSQQCISVQEIQRTGHGLFPQFEVRIACRGCREGDSSCLAVTGKQCFYRKNALSYLPLVRGHRCDQEGYEIWTAAEHSRQFNAACSCIRA